MARLPALVEALAAHDRRGKPTVAHIARRVRDAGLIASTKRGAGAAVMTAADATTLLLAVCGDSSPLGAVEAVYNLRSLQPEPDDKLNAVQRKDLPERLSFLRAKTGFAETVERLIIHAPEITAWHNDYVEDWEQPDMGLSEAEFSMQRMVRKFSGPGAFFRPGYARAVRIVSYVPGLAAEIHLGRIWKQIEERDAFHEYYAPPNAWKARPQGKGKPRGAGEARAFDCLITIEVGLPTLLALHNAVFDDG